MRRDHRFATLALVLGLGAAAAPAPARAESTRTLRLELSGDPGRPFAVENLAGRMTVVPGTGETVVAIATVHAESDALAGLMRFEQVPGKKGVPTLRLRYPVDRHTSFRYPGSSDGSKGAGLVGRLFGGRSRIEYDGTRVTVSDGSGVLLYADVEVRLPRRSVDAHLRNAVGPISGEDVEGRITFDTGSGDVALSDVRGEIVADTGSGDVTVRDARGGELVCDTGSGDCDVHGFEGERLRCDTGSGAVRVADVTARLVAVDTGSGDVTVEDADVEEFEVDTGSGDVELTTRGDRLGRVKADTGSGDLRLRLAPDASFELRASTGSGDIESGYDDARAIVHRKEVVGYRRGDGRLRITADTGSGDVTVEPGR
jgi:Toastrack DUF4097